MFQICLQSPSVAFLSSSLNATPDSVHMFCLFKNTCFLLSFPRALCLSFSRSHPPSFLPTFSLLDLCSTLTFTPFLWLFSGRLSFFLLFSHASAGYEMIVLCLWQNGNRERKRGEVKGKKDFCLEFVGAGGRY